MRTALMVARLGNLKAAAEVLGVHPATVNRHVDTLEDAFGGSLFQRQARGSALTETGRELLEVVSRTEEMFTDLAGRSRGGSGKLSGTLVVTALAGIAPLVMPTLREFHFAHPETALEFVAGAHVAPLEHSEAHVAFRVGAEVDAPDYIVLPFSPIRFGLYASREYVAKNGRPDVDQFDGHRFVDLVGEPSPVPYANWMESNVPNSAFALRTTDQQVVKSAVCEGLGLGFLAEHDAANQPDLVEIIPPSDEWSTALWAVTHVDLQHTAKVQEFLNWIKALKA